MINTPWRGFQLPKRICNEWRQDRPPPLLIIVCVLSAFLLPKRICSERRHNRFPPPPIPLSLVFHQHSSSQGGSAVSGAKIVLPHYNLCFICRKGSAVNGAEIASPQYRLCFISIPAPKKDLQGVAPKSFPPNYRLRFISLPAHTLQ